MDVQALKNRPDADLKPEEALLLRHFLSLSQQRPSSFSNVPCHIPISQIEAFHRVYQVGEYMDLVEFADVMIELDGLLIAHCLAKAEREERRRHA